MSINAKLDSLYGSWSQQYPSFIKGGVVDEDWYIDARPKLLFVLKEVNSDDPHWSLVDLVHRQIQDRKLLDVWETIALFTLLFDTGLRPFKAAADYGRYLENAGYCEALQKIAVTNIKKTCGGGQSDGEEIMEYAKRDKDLIATEIDLIAPDIVICGGTFDILSKVLGLTVEECATGARYAKHKDAVYIDMPHPRARVSKKVLYAYFRETILELKAYYG